MSSPSLPSRLPGLGARLLVTVAALAGLFAMHGLADHQMPSAPIAAAATAATDHGGHHEPEPGIPASHGAAELCLALLGLAFVLVVALTRGGVLLRPSRGTTTRWRALAPRARFRDPPDLFGLSVQRC